MSSLVDASKIGTGGEATESELLAAHRMYEQLVGLWAPAIIEAAVDLGLFEAMTDRAWAAEELSDRLGTDPRATRVLLDALYAYGIVDRAPVSGPLGHGYTLREPYLACLLGNGDLSLVGKVAYDRCRAWDAWRGISGAVRDGARGTDAEADETDRNQITGSEYRSLVRGIDFWAIPIVGALEREARQRGWDACDLSVLDVGCGTGLYSRLLLRRFPSWTATGLDCSEIAPICAEGVRSHGLDDRMIVRVADFMNDDWGEGHDLVLFVNIFHLQSPTLAQRLMLGAAKALAPGGTVCIVDQIRTDEAPDDSPQERFALLFAASMLATGGGDTYHVEVYDEWLAMAGLRRTNLIDTPMHRILLATRS